MGMSVISSRDNPERIHERIPAMWTFLSDWLHPGRVFGPPFCSCGKGQGSEVDHVPGEQLPALLAFMKEHEHFLSDEPNDWPITHRQLWRRTIALFERCPAGFDYI
jgi:hypothetical protein